MGINLNPNPASHEMVQDMAMAVGLTENQRLLLCDLGYFNEIMRGYLIRALEKVGYDDGVIDRALGCFESVLDECTAKEARNIYRRYINAADPAISVVEPQAEWGGKKLRLD